ncbi:MAG: ABC transporter ATP-binding protein [Chloroflexi bacterium]|nr:ABC transporter ATP-binding protein [Chloroflexota bacterium]
MRIVLRLLVFTKKYWRVLLFAFICLIATTIFSLIIPRVLGQGIDTVLSSGQRRSLIIAAIIIISASILRGLTAYVNRYLTQVVSQRVSYDIRNAIYDRLQRLSFAYHDKAQTGQLMSRATVDIEAVRRFLGEGLLTLGQTVLLIGGIAYILIAMDWQLALLTLAFMPAIAWRAIVVGKRLRPVWLRVQQLMGALGTTLQASLSGIRVVKAFSRQQAESQKFAADARKLYDAQTGAARLQALNMPMMAFLLSLPTALILWYGGGQVITGSLTMGGITQFILYMGMLAQPIRRLGFIVNMFSRTVSAGQRILEIIDAESLVKEKTNATELGKLKGQVSFENVSFSYDSLGPALNDISFSVQPGQLVALLGGSGSGKSTLINLISRFYDVSSGHITVDGIDIRDVTLVSLRRNVAIAQQDVFLFSATIRDNIAYGAPEATMEQIVTAAKAAQIHDFIQSLPDSYNTWVGERGVTLSGGEKQRLVIARALLMNPSILILDDSTSSVDAETEHLIRLALDKLIQGRTTFVITHRLPIIRNADIILMLKDGHIAEMGKHEKLMARDGLYRQTYLSQLAATQDSAEKLTEAQ